jgi:lambda family phage minor tail protein L
MTDVAPQSQLDDAQKLESDGMVELYEIQLQPSGVLYLKNNNEVIYQGQTYEGTAIQIQGVIQSANDEVARPKLTVANTLGVFSSAVDRGELDKATVIRRRVLRDDLVNDRPYYIDNSWVVSRVLSLNKHAIVLELRGQMDGQFFLFPPRMFMPPEFPQVSLS